MKLNKTKFLIPSLAIVAGACLVGSVSGTVAWYQYSTRVTASFVGTSVKCSEVLQVKASTMADVNNEGVEGTGEGYSARATDWKGALVTSDLTGTLKAKSDKIEPVTPLVTDSSIGANSALPAGGFKRNPLYQSFPLNDWRAATRNVHYIQYKLSVRNKEVSSDSDSYYARNLYLSNVTIQDHDALADKYDLSPALRVHLANNADAGKNILLSSETASVASPAAVALSGALDLNGDGNDDATGKYEWDTPVAGTYGVSGKTETAAGNGALVTSNVNTGALTIGGSSYVLGQIPATEDGLTFTVTIWLEGWVELNPKADLVVDSTDGRTDTSKTYLVKADNTVYKYVGDAWEAQPKASLWDAGYANQTFDVGFEFAVQPYDVEEA